MHPWTQTKLPLKDPNVCSSEKLTKVLRFWLFRQIIRGMTFWGLEKFLRYYIFKYLIYFIHDQIDIKNLRWKHWSMSKLGLWRFEEQKKILPLIQILNQVLHFWTANVIQSFLSLWFFSWEPSDDIRHQVILFVLTYIIKTITI